MWIINENKRNKYVKRNVEVSIVRKMSVNGKRGRGKPRKRWKSVI